MDPRGALNLKESTVPLLEQLDDPSGKVRQKACNLLSLASCDAASSAIIMQNNGVQKILHRVGDQCAPVVGSALLALRNLILTGDQRVISLLTMESNLNLILRAFNNAREQLSNTSEAAVATQILCHAMGIYWNLVVEKEQIVDFILRAQLLTAIAKFLNISEYPTELVTTAIHLLAAMTDEHAGAIHAVCNMAEVVPSLIKITQCKPQKGSGCMPIIPVLCSAVLFNIRNKNEPLAALTHVLPPVRYSLSEIRPNEEISGLVSRLHEGGENVYKDKDFVDAVEYSKNSVEAQIAGLEILSNVCCMEEWLNSDEEEMGEGAALQIPNELKEFCLSIPLPNLMNMCQPLNSEVMKQIEESPAVFSELTDFIQDRTSRAFACLSNIFAVVDPTEFPIPVEEIWAELIRLYSSLSENLNGKNLKDIEGVTSVMRAFLCNCPSITFLQDAHLEGIVSLCENLFSPEIRQCGIAMLLFVTVQKEFTHCEQLYNKTTNLLLKKLGDESITVVNEALNAIFDICGQDEALPMCKSLNILSVLSQFQPIFVNRVSQKRNLLDEEEFDMLQETQGNLSDFIQYLQSQ